MSKYNKKPFTKKGYNDKYAVKKVDKTQDKAIKRIERKVNAMENRKELKYRDVVVDDPFSTNGQITSLNPIDRGDQYFEREGDNIYTKSIRISYIITKPAAVLNSDQSPPFQVRCVLMWDKANNGSSAVQLFTGATPTPIEEANSIFDNRQQATIINAPYYQGTRDRFKVLYDRIHVINNSSSMVANSLVVRKTIPLSGAKILFTNAGDTGAPAEIPQRQLLWITFCAGSADTAQNFTSRLFYTDD